MQLVLKAILPRNYEAIWYYIFGLLLLVVLNVSGVIDVVLAVSQTDPDVQILVDSSLVGVLRDVSSPLNGRLGNSVVWAFMGVLAFTLGSVAISGVQDLLDHSDEARKKPKKLRASVWAEYGARVIIRFVALLALLVWMVIVIAVVVPYASSLLLESLLAPMPYIWGLLALLLGGALVGFSLYTAAILSRFVALRVRVFSS